MEGGRIAVADEDEGAGTLFQHEGKVLAGHGRIDIGVDIGSARHLGRDGDGMFGFPVVIDGHRAFAFVIDLRLGAMGADDTFDDLADPRFGKIAMMGMTRSTTPPLMRMTNSKTT